MKKISIQEVDVAEIPQVTAYVEAKERLDRFITANSVTFMEYQKLLDDCNAAKDDADRVVREMRVNCGPFKVHAVVNKIRGKDLADFVGQSVFLQYGGVIETTNTFKINEDDYERMKSDGVIPPDANFEIQELRYKK